MANMQNSTCMMRCNIMHLISESRGVDVMAAEEIKVPRQAGACVRRAREGQGLTRRELAALSGVSERSLASLELGDAAGIRLDKLLSVLHGLNLSLWVHGEVTAGKVPASPVGQDPRSNGRSLSMGEEFRPPRAHADLDKHAETPEVLRDYDRLFDSIVRDAISNGRGDADGRY